MITQTMISVEAVCRAENTPGSCVIALVVSGDFLPAPGPLD
jgi:hypothetical protein